MEAGDKRSGLGGNPGLTLDQMASSSEHLVVLRAQGRRLAPDDAEVPCAIEATLQWKITNGTSESNNAAIGRV